MNKKIVRRNLPINETYKIVNSYYTGGMDNGCACDNCNKIIANVAVIQNSLLETFNVGLDCAETLSRVDGLHSVLADFAEAKAIRAKVNKALKENCKITFSYTTFGEVRIMAENDRNTRVNETKSVEFTKAYLPDYLNQISNPNKAGFKPTIVNLELPKLSYLEFKDYFATPRNFTIPFTEYVINVVYGNYEPFKHPTTNEIIINKGYIIKLQTTALNTLETRQTYMHNDIESRANWMLNDYLFNLYNA